MGPVAVATAMSGAGLDSIFALPDLHEAATPSSSTVPATTQAAAAAAHHGNHASHGIVSHGNGGGANPALHYSNMNHAVNPNPPPKTPGSAKKPPLLLSPSPARASRTRSSPGVLGPRKANHAAGVPVSAQSVSSASTGGFGPHSAPSLASMPASSSPQVAGSNPQLNPAGQGAPGGALVAVGSHTGRVRVTVRLRPRNDNDAGFDPRTAQAADRPHVVCSSADAAVVIRRTGAVAARGFRYDAVLDDSADQAETYNTVAAPIVRDVLNGYK